MIIKGYRVGPLVKQTAREFINDGALGLAAETAYYFFFSLFPFLLFLAPILSLVGDKRQLFDWLLGHVGAAVPPAAMQMLTSVAHDVIFSKSAPGIMSVGALLALYTGSNVFASVMDALNHAYDITETRSWWRRRLIAFACVIGGSVIVLGTTVIMLAGDTIADWLGARLGLGQSVTLAWKIVQFPLAIAILVGFTFLLYYVLPNVRQRWQQVLVGAVVATVLWLLVTLIFRFYVQHFAAYNKTYGTIGGVIVLLTWMYLTMLVLLAGGELNSELHHGTGAVSPVRGAVYLGRVVSGRGPGRSSDTRIQRVRAASGDE